MHFPVFYSALFSRAIQQATIAQILEHKQLNRLIKTFSDGHLGETVCVELKVFPFNLPNKID
jgi:hypothetical protein